MHLGLVIVLVITMVSSSYDRLKPEITMHLTKGRYGYILCNLDITTVLDDIHMVVPGLYQN